jgi:hypothetical protein
MKRYMMVASFVLILGIGLFALAQGFKHFGGALIGYEEVPAVSTAGRGNFNAQISRDGSSVSWQLSYANLEGSITQAHIHLGQRGVNGGISVFLCTNLGNGPAGTPPCPPGPATISGTFTAADVIGPNAQGIAPGEYDELVRAIRAGATYANVHTTAFPGGEIRSQLDPPSAGPAHGDH